MKKTRLSSGLLLIRDCLRPFRHPLYPVHTPPYRGRDTPTTAARAHRVFPRCEPQGLGLPAPRPYRYGNVNGWGIENSKLDNNAQPERDRYTSANGSARGPTSVSLRSNLVPSRHLRLQKQEGDLQ